MERSSKKKEVRGEIFEKKVKDFTDILRKFVYTPNSHDFMKTEEEKIAEELGLSLSKGLIISSKIEELAKKMEELLTLKDVRSLYNLIVAKFYLIIYGKSWEGLDELTRAGIKYFPNNLRCQLARYFFCKLKDSKEKDNIKEAINIREAMKRKEPIGEERSIIQFFNL